MTTQPQPTILLIGQEAPLAYLLARFAEHSGYHCQVASDNAAGPEPGVVEPALVIFLSLELLARGQGEVAELVQSEAPILVCASTGEEAQARELGADYCLLHPLSYSDFQAALATVTAPRGVDLG